MYDSSRRHLLPAFVELTLASWWRCRVGPARRVVAARARALSRQSHSLRASPRRFLARSLLGPRPHPRSGRAVHMLKAAACADCACRHRSGVGGESRTNASRGAGRAALGASRRGRGAGGQASAGSNGCAAAGRETAQCRRGLKARAVSHPACIGAAMISRRSLMRRGSVGIIASCCGGPRVTGSAGLRCTRQTAFFAVDV